MLLVDLLKTSAATLHSAVFLLRNRVKVMRNSSGKNGCNKILLFLHSSTAPQSAWLCIDCRCRFVVVFFFIFCGKNFDCLILVRACCCCQIACNSHAFKMSSALSGCGYQRYLSMISNFAAFYLRLFTVCLRLALKCKVLWLLVARFIVQLCINALMCSFYSF